MCNVTPSARISFSAARARKDELRLLEGESVVMSRTSAATPLICVLEWVCCSRLQ